MKYLIPILSLLLFSCGNSKTVLDNSKTENTITYEKQSIHQFQVKDISGEDFDFKTLEGKKIMVVNTASKCGLTPQYEDLQVLYEKYKDKGFVIVGFPANNFMGQEPGTDEKIQTFCTSKYGVTFPMMSKISVKGKEMHPVYQFLTSLEKNGVSDSKVSWNFQKYLLNEKGELVTYKGPKTKPLNEEIIAWIESK